MHGTADFAAFLDLYERVQSAPYLTDAEKQNVMDCARYHFAQRAHDQRLLDIVMRLTDRSPDGGERKRGRKAGP